jgi:hypothetical protein
VEAAKDILARNAIHFYKINFANSVVSSHNSLPLTVIDELESDVSFVRIIWVDNSGQHRCRVSSVYTISVNVDTVWRCFIFILCSEILSNVVSGCS